jgi:hypothetical protein
MEKQKLTQTKQQNNLIKNINIMEQVKKLSTNSKEVKEAIKKHIIDCVYNYDEKEFNTIQEAAKHLYNEFKRCTEGDGFLRNKSDQDKFSYWLTGLPFHFHFSYFDIENFLNSLGINPEGKTFDNDKSQKLYHYLIYRETIKHK